MPSKFTTFPHNCKCLNCEKTFHLPQSSIKRGFGKYCSWKCREDHHVSTEENRFWANVQKTDKCWIWIGRRTKQGYGSFSGLRQGLGVFPENGRISTSAHRFSWKFKNGPIPNGLDVLHYCDTPPCVNPDHLWLGTDLDNMRDKVRKGRQNSPSGIEHYHAHMTSEDAIRAMRKENTKFPMENSTVLRISQKYGVSANVVRNVIYRKSYKNVI
jgi:hypothetical protein